MTKDFDIISDMEKVGVTPPPSKISIEIPNADDWFYKVYEEILKADRRVLRKNKHYDDIILWLKGNNQSGLIIMGSCGLGKSMIAKYIIPYIVMKVYGRIFKVVNASEISNKKTLEDILENRLIVLDDIGTEEMIMEYGNRIDPIPIIVDRAEKEGKLLIITTNLTPSQIKDRYGDRIADRIRYLCKQVAIKGESYRC